jgi:hypothetical protein
LSISTQSTSSVALFNGVYINGINAIFQQWEIDSGFDESPKNISFFMAGRHLGAWSPDLRYGSGQRNAGFFFRRRKIL